MILEEKYAFKNSNTTQGTQPKWKKDNWFYKQDQHGHEGFVEWLVSELLKLSDMENFVVYEQCEINGKNGCRSKNFLSEGETFVTAESLYERATGYSGLSDYLLGLDNPEKRLEYLLKLFQTFDVDAREYFGQMLQLDYLICNIDRHVHNYGLVLSHAPRIAPVFDHGLSLDTNHSGEQIAATISGSFEAQLAACSFPIKSYFQIDYSKAGRLLNEFDNHEVNLLKMRLVEYQKLFPNP